MNKLQFTLALQEKLQGLPKEDIHRSLEYYNEMIDDRMEDGLSEEEAVAAIGSVEEIAQQILEDMPMSKQVMVRLRTKRKLAGWEIALLIILAPVWLSLLVGLASGVFSTYMGVWAVIITLYAVGWALGIGGVGCVAGALVLLFTGQFIQALTLFSCAFIFAGVGIFILIGGKYTVQGTIWVTKKLIAWVRYLFTGKEAK